MLGLKAAYKLHCNVLDLCRIAAFYAVNSQFLWLNWSTQIKESVCRAPLAPLKITQMDWELASPTSERLLCISQRCTDQNLLWDLHWDIGRGFPPNIWIKWVTSFEVEMQLMVMVCQSASCRAGETLWLRFMWTPAPATCRNSLDERPNSSKESRIAQGTDKVSPLGTPRSTAGWNCPSEWVSVPDWWFCRKCCFFSGLSEGLVSPLPCSLLCGTTK